MDNFTFPLSLNGLDLNDPTVTKDPIQSAKYISFMSNALVYEPEKLCENISWFSFAYFLTKKVNEAYVRVLGELLKNQLDKATAGQLSKPSERIALFLVACFLTWNQHKKELEHQKLLKALVRYLKDSSLIGEAFHLLVGIGVSNVKELLGHTVVAILLSHSEEAGRKEMMVKAFSQVEMVSLLRRLNLQRMEGEDSEGERRFREQLRSTNSDFVEGVVHGYLGGVNALYAKQNREVVLQLARHLGEIFAKRFILDQLLCYYDKGNYFIRNTATLALGELLKKSVYEEEIEIQLLSLLVNRTYDSHVHARACALYVLKDLLKSKSIGYSQDFLIKAVERLRDKSAFGRKAAATLLNEVVIHFHRRFGQTAFRKKVLDERVKEVDNQKTKLMDQCLKIQEQLRQGLDLKHNLDELELELQECRTKELNLRQQQLFYEQISRALGDLKCLALSKSTMESPAALKTLQTLLKYHFDGSMAAVRQILILVYQKESVQEITNLVKTEFALKHYKLIQLVEQCDLLEIAALEEVFKQINWNGQGPTQGSGNGNNPVGNGNGSGAQYQNLTDSVLNELRSKKNILPNLRILKFLRLEKQIAFHLELLLQLGQQGDYEQITEILLIVAQLPHPDVHLVFVKVALSKLLEAQLSTAWFQCCDQFTRFVVEHTQKPELILHALLNASLPVPNLLFAAAGATLKLFVYSDKLIKGYEHQCSDEDASIKEHLESKAATLNQFFQDLDKHPIAKTAAAILDSLVNDPHRERHLLADNVCLISLLQLMLLSKPLLAQCSPNLLAVLDSPHHASLLRANMLALLADLYYRHPHHIPVQKLLHRLDDPHLRVKRTAIVILAHLMLMGLLKLDLGPLARRLNDQDPPSRLHAQLFFSELYKKEPQQLYQLLPDLITQMAHNRQVSDDDFSSFAERVIPIIEKDRLAEQMLAKFLSRFEIFAREAEAKSLSIQQLMEEGREEVISFDPLLLSPNREAKFLTLCLVHLKYHLENLRYLVSHFSLYKQYVRIPEILEQFKAIYGKCRKIAITQKIHARKQNAQAAPEYDQLLCQFKANLQQIDPNFEKATLIRPSKKVQISKKKQAAPLQQTVRREDSDDSSSMDIEQ